LFQKRRSEEEREGVHWEGRGNTELRTKGSGTQDSGVESSSLAALSTCLLLPSSHLSLATLTKRNLVGKGGSMTPGHSRKASLSGGTQEWKGEALGTVDGGREGRAGRGQSTLPEGRGSILLPFSWLERLNFSCPKKNLLCQHAEHSRNSKNAGDENGVPNTEEYVYDSGL